MPENTVYVGRGNNCWGNPFRVGVWGNAQECVDAYRKYMSNTISDESTAWKNSLYTDPGFDKSYSPYTGFSLISAHSLDEIRGKNLACWCPLDQPCHADVLLELANSEKP